MSPVRSTRPGTYAGYHDCPCRDCFEIAIGEAAPGTPALCHACADAGCDADGDADCCCEPEPDIDMESTSSTPLGEHIIENHVIDPDASTVTITLKAGPSVLHIFRPLKLGGEP